MRNRFRILIFTLIVGGAALAAPRVGEVLAEIPLFEVRGLRVEGLSRLTEAELEAHLALPTGASLFGDLPGWEARLREHPLILEARLERELLHTLGIRVVEREPVALLPTPSLIPVDGEGTRLPIDPVAHRLDLPLLRPLTVGEESEALGLSGGEPLSDFQLRVLAGEVERLRGLDPELALALSEAAMDASGDVIFDLLEPRTTLRFRPPLTPGRLRDGLEVLDDALRRRPNAPPLAIDLRFADQVVVRYTLSSP